MLRRGDRLYTQGETASQVFFIRRGTVMLTRGDQARAVRKDGTFVGLESLVDGTYADSANVMAPTMICAVDRTAFESWLGEPGAPVRVAFMQILGEAASALPRPTARADAATKRVAHWLATAAPDGEQRVPRRHTAELLGMVPETLSRALARLAAEGLIDVGRRGVRVDDMAGLRRRAGLDEPRDPGAGDDAVAVAIADEVRIG
jgi:CRP-like cAMP-binding protein